MYQLFIVFVNLREISLLHLTQIFGMQTDLFLIVEDVNEAPVILVKGLDKLPEDSPIGSVVANIVVDDPEKSSLLSCSIRSPGTPFILRKNATSGEFHVAQNALLDFETQEKYDVIVGCQDGMTETLKVDSRANCYFHCKDVWQYDC